MNKELICIVCPNGCRLTVDENLNVIGNKCPRGATYAKQELTNPTRVLTSTVKIESKELGVLPVKTANPIPKGKLFDAMKVVNSIKVKAPVELGQVIYKDICGTGVDLVACRTIKE
ncbi:MAG: DUF1667 domain-containing protein [Bacilli bacterium]|nr:DUF1667 domain-containing protein [Bacilli bacterium]